MTTKDNIIKFPRQVTDNERRREDIAASLRDLADRVEAGYVDGVAFTWTSSSANVGLWWQITDEANLHNLISGVSLVKTQLVNHLLR